mgnify:CR=1 FL=1
MLYLTEDLRPVVAEKATVRVLFALRACDKTWKTTVAHEAVRRRAAHAAEITLLTSNFRRCGHYFLHAYERVSFTSQSAVEAYDALPQDVKEILRANTNCLVNMVRDYLLAIYTCHQLPGPFAHGLQEFRTMYHALLTCNLTWHCIARSAVEGDGVYSLARAMCARTDDCEADVRRGSAHLELKKP